MTTRGEVLCWGWMESAATIDPSNEYLVGWSAQRVPGIVGARAVTRSYSAVCALDGHGEAFCAGRSTVGELGGGTNASSPVFAPVAGGHRWRSISAGWFHVCGIRVQGDAYCWGNQFLGGLGNGETDGFSAVPVPVAIDTQFISIAAGGAFTCAIDSEGQLWCWGKGTSGETARGDPIQPAANPAVPERGATDTRFVAVVAGGDYACALGRDGRAWCWGLNSLGQLGRGTAVSSGTPAPVRGSRRYRSLSAGTNFVCANGVDGISDCWGVTRHTSFGDPPGPEPDLVPTSVSFPWIRLREVRAVGLNRCGLALDAQLYCWGQGHFGQLGDGSSEPARLVPKSPVVSR